MIASGLKMTNQEIITVLLSIVSFFFGMLAGQTIGKEVGYKQGWDEAKWVTKQLIQGKEYK